MDRIRTWIRTARDRHVVRRSLITAAREVEKAHRENATESTYERLKDAFIFEPRGTIKIKGKGSLATYFLVARR